jgi:tight adherence protein B
MRLGQSVETTFSEWAEDALCEDIREFAEVLYIAKRTGGVVQQVIADTERVIREKQETLRYIQSVLHSREYETKVMKSMPFAMLAYLLLFMPDFLEPLYHNLAGICLLF